MMKLYKNKEWMEEKYLVEQLDISTMADLANCGQTTIGRWLSKFEIPARTQAETMRIAYGKRNSKGMDKVLYEDKEWLRQQYWENGLTSVEISEMAGCSPPTILRRLEEFGIGKRTMSERAIMVWDKNLEDLTGRKFGKLTPLEPAGTNHRHQRLWKCKCDCGNITTKITTELKLGHVKSCGCMKYPSRMPAGEASFNKLLYVYKRNAENRGYKFELSREEFRRLIQEPCYYCNTPSSQSHYAGGNGAFIYTGLDRLNNERGYVHGNVVPCCKQCNYAKMENTPQEFADWITRIYNHWVVSRNEADL